MTKVADCLEPRGATVKRRERGRVLIAGRLGDVDPEAANPELTIAVGETMSGA